ncbi:TadE family protein [Micrococcus terreus]|nr:TadE family protein [Micrococcus terreus]
MLPPLRDDEGSAVAESVMVMALLAVVFAAVLQFGLIIHVRNTVIDAASAGARHGALADRTPADGADRTRDLLASSVPGADQAEITASLSEGPVPTVTVTVRTQMPMVGFITGPVDVEATGRAYRFD